MDKEVHSIEIPVPKQFSFKECYSFLNRGYNECLFHVSNDEVSRAIRIKNKVILIKVSASNSSLLIDYHQTSNSEVNHQDIEHYLIDWFDLNRDISTFYEALRSNSITKLFPKKYFGLRLIGIVDLFEALCWCVIGQQINLTFAHKVKSRLVHRFGDFIENQGMKYYCFPTPDKIIQAKDEELAEMQFSRQKISYLKNIAEAFISHNISKEDLLKLSSKNQIKKLTEIKGVGPWTANYASMKCLRNMNCIAYGDTGLSSALLKHFGTDKKPSYEVIDEIFSEFKGWESYLNFYLWRSLSA